MMADSTPQYNPIPSQLYVYVDNVDEAYRRGLKAGGTSEQEPTTQFYGDRTAAVKDPTGNVWWIASRVEDVCPEELEKRMKGRGPAVDSSTPTENLVTRAFENSDSSVESVVSLFVM